MNNKISDRHRGTATPHSHNDNKTSIDIGLVLTSSTIRSTSDLKLFTFTRSWFVLISFPQLLFNSIFIKCIYINVKFYR